MKYALAVLMTLLVAGPVFAGEMEWPGIMPEMGREEARLITGLPSLGGVVAIRLFQRYISPLDGPRCAFTPSCSSYGLGCVRRHGPIIGYLRTCDRLMRCHGGAGGYPLRGRLFWDPVP